MKGPLDRHPGVLEAGQVDDALDAVIGQRPADTHRVDDRPVDERGARRDELSVPARQVVEDDHPHPGGLERSGDVGADVAGASGD